MEFILFIFINNFKFWFSIWEFTFINDTKIWPDKEKSCELALEQPSPTSESVILLTVYYFKSATTTKSGTLHLSHCYHILSGITAFFLYQWTQTMVATISDVGSAKKDLL